MSELFEVEHIRLVRFLLWVSEGTDEKSEYVERARELIDQLGIEYKQSGDRTGDRPSAT